MDDVMGWLIVIVVWAAALWGVGIIGEKLREMEKHR